MTDVTGAGIRNLLAGNLRKSAGIMCFGNGLPRQSVPQGHLLRGAHWLAMAGFLPVGGAAMGGQVVRPYEIAKSACIRADRDGSLCGFHNN